MDRCINLEDFNKLHTESRKLYSSYPKPDPSIFHRYREAGLAPIPISTDGSKKPLIPWKRFQTEIPSAAEIDGWFGLYLDQPGVAIATGIASRMFEVLDFDDPTVFPYWIARIPNELYRRLPIVYTPSNRWHVLYRCESIEGNQKLAMSSDGKVRVETRGIGGYVLTVGSPAKCHRANMTYDWAGGPPIIETPTITTSERQLLISAARSFHEGDQLAIGKQHILERSNVRTQSAIGMSPWERMDRFGNWRDILEPHGWRSSDGVKWTRPGKREGASAVVGVGKNGCEILTVFSTNAGSLSPTAGHINFGKFGAYAALEHNGDRRAAARLLSKNGFNFVSASIVWLSRGPKSSVKVSL